MFKQQLFFNCSHKLMHIEQMLSVHVHLRRLFEMIMCFMGHQSTGEQAKWWSYSFYSVHPGYLTNAVWKEHKDAYRDLMENCVRKCQPVNHCFFLERSPNTMLKVIYTHICICIYTHKHTHRHRRRHTHSHTLTHTHITQHICLQTIYFQQGVNID